MYHTWWSREVSKTISRIVLLSVIVLIVSCILFGCNDQDPKAQRVTAGAYAKQVEYDGRVDLERAQAEADAVRAQARAEAYAITESVRQQTMQVTALITEAQKDNAAERWQRNMITLSTIGGFVSVIVIAGCMIWMTCQQRESAREREEADRRFWHAIAMMQRERFESKWEDLDDGS